MLDLANYTIRAFKKKDGKISFHLKSFILVTTNITFSLTAYLSDFHCSFILPDGHEIEFKRTAISVRLFFPYEFNTMAYYFKASTISDFKDIKPCLAKLNITYNICFTGHDSECSKILQKVVPIVTCF